MSEEFFAHDGEAHTLKHRCDINQKKSLVNSTRCRNMPYTLLSPNRDALLV
jgi:hypothetical protein